MIERTKEALNKNGVNKIDMYSKSPQVPESRRDLVILQSIRRIIRAVDIHSRKLRSECDLTAPQLMCLTAVKGHGPMTVSEIANELFLSPSTVVGILDRLEIRGLIARERDTVDRRVVNISATPTGKKVASNLPSALQDGLHDGLKRLSKREQLIIADALKKVVELMEAEEIDAAPILESITISNNTKANKRED